MDLRRHHHGGSSPPARGARYREFHAHRGAGIIPACAGSTRRQHGGEWCSSDHPRLRGEHADQVFGSTNVTGSSPPARGARKVPPGTHCAAGIIPACAGSTRASDSIVRRASGSSPPARGARGRHRRRHCWRRIIPACAGSTHALDEIYVSRRDHPRLRGEHRSSSAVSHGANGSSPPARGAHAVRLRSRLSNGIIPACAGSTEPSGCPSAWRGDHPRLRGEHVGSGGSGGQASGSSPPARGARWPPRRS